MTKAIDPQDPLKPERIQRRLSDEQVRMRLKLSPGWTLVATGRAVERTRSFPRYPQAVMFANLAAALAEASERYPVIELRESEVTIRLEGAALGLSDNDFHFIRVLDAVGAGTFGEE
jgi:pterin-4a-carbinolamine dehydratase